MNMIKLFLETDRSGNQTVKNVYGKNLLTRTVGSDTMYYMCNRHADVTALLSDNSTIAATYYYDAFGNIFEQTEMSTTILHMQDTSMTRRQSSTI